MADLTAAQRCEAIEAEIAKCNAQLREFRKEEPQSESDLRNLRSSQDWVETQRDRYVSQRIGFEAELALERAAKLQAALRASQPDMQRFKKMKDDAEKALEEAERGFEQIRWQNSEISRDLQAAELEVRYFQEQRFDRERRERLEPLRARLLAL